MPSLVFHSIFRTNSNLIKKTNQNDGNSILLNGRWCFVAAPFDIFQKKVTKICFFEAIDWFWSATTARVVDFHRNITVFVEIDARLHLVAE